MLSGNTSDDNERIPSLWMFCIYFSCQDSAVSVHIPKLIFENFRAVGLKHDNIALQLLVYKNAKLFPNVVNNKTGQVMKERNVSSSVISMQLGKWNVFISFTFGQGFGEKKLECENYG